MIGMYNLDKNSQPFGKKCQKISGGGVLTHTVCIRFCGQNVKAEAYSTQHSAVELQSLVVFALA